MENSKKDVAEIIELDNTEFGATSIFDMCGTGNI